MNKFAKICLGIAGAIMLTFFIVQTCIVMRWCEPTYFLAEFGYGCVIAFMPPFFYVVYDFIRTTRLKEANIDLQLAAIDKSNLVVMMDMDGYILEANSKFCNTMRCSEKELKHKQHKRMVPKEYADSLEYHEFWERLKRGETISGEFERVAKDGSSVWLFGNYTPIQSSDGSYNKVLKIATDITLQHESEVLVNQKNSYLEHAAKILRHDMHSGINTYMPRGLSSLQRRLSEEKIKQLKIDAPLRMLAEGLKHTQKVYAGVKEFTNLVKEDAQLDMKECNLSEILRNYLSSTSYVSQVKIERLPFTEVNEPLFCTAIDNLIRNGLKYNDSSTKMVKIYMENDSTICVEDNGRGITNEEFIELSKPYTRKEGQKEGGSGLGLNICIAILKEHGFKITAEKLDSGTKLKIKLK
jgi:PAS domain S-box-containing protein